MPRLTLRFLGRPQVELDGQPLVLDTRKAVAVLAYLAATGQGHRRETLAALLWPDEDGEHARAALRRTLSTLKSAGAGPWLDAGRDAVTLLPGPELSNDVERFRSLLSEPRTHAHPTGQICPRCLPALTEAVALYRGDFLAGLSLRDSAEFDDWQLFESENLRRSLAGALEMLSDGCAAAGEYEAAVAHARRWLGLDPLHEPAHRRLMLLYAWTGQRSAALRQYRECVRVLDQELGVAPLEETGRLYQLITENRIPPPPAPFQDSPDAGSPILRTAEKPAKGLAQSLTQSPAPAGPTGSRRLALPLVGRSAEWAGLTRAYEERAATGCWAAIEGEAGIGKTRLAEDFLAQVHAQGTTVISVRCYPGEAGVPYGPIAGALRAILAHAACTERLAGIAPHWLSEAARLLPEIENLRPGLPPAPAADAPGAQSRFFEGLRQVLLTVCQGSAPNVVFFDDLHWADEASLDLLAYLTRRLENHPLFLLSTWRRQEGSIFARLQGLIAEAQRVGNGVLLEPGRLRPADVKTILGAATAQTAAVTPSKLAPDMAAPSAPDVDPLDALSAQLYRESEGVPFFVVAYLEANLGSQDSESRKSAGSKAAEAAWPMPRDVRDLLRARLAGLDAAGLQILQAAAVVGRSFDLEILQHAAGRSEDESTGALEQLMGQGLIFEILGDDASAAPRYDFSHDKLRELVYEDTSLARRRLLHGRVARALAGRVPSRPLAGLDGAGRPSRAQPAARAGGQALGQTAGQSAWQSAAQATARAAARIARHYQLAGQEDEAAAYYVLAGEQAVSLYANAEALAHFEAALALGYPDPIRLHEAIGDLRTLQGVYNSALASYENAAALCLAGNPVLGVLERKLGNVYHRQGDWEAAESHYAAARTALEAAGAPGELARLYAGWSHTVHRRADAARALELAEQALAVADMAGDDAGRAEALNILGILARSRGETPTAVEYLRKSLTIAERVGDPGCRVAALNNLALAYAADGDPASALAQAGLALELAQAQGDRHHEAAMHNNLADLLHAAGREAEAMAHVRSAVVILAEIGLDAGDLNAVSLRPEIWKLTEW